MGGRQGGVAPTICVDSNVQPARSVAVATSQLGGIYGREGPKGYAILPSAEVAVSGDVSRGWQPQHREQRAASWIRDARLSRATVLHGLCNSLLASGPALG